MTYKKDILLEVADLLFLSIDSSISDEQFGRLETLLQDDPSAREYYFDLLFTTIGLNETEGILSLGEGGCLLGEVDLALWQALAEDEKTAPGVLVEKPTEKPVEPRLGLVRVEKPKRTMSRLSVYTLILSAAAMLFLMILVLSSPIRPIVATLTDSINAEWVSEDEMPAKWDVFRQGELTLVKGLAEITFDDGAVVVVEAPAVIELLGPNRIFLKSGKLSAIVSEYATGFTVKTPSASIVDLGTEFGVSVVGDGSCSVDMFKGRANLIAGGDKQKKTSQIVNVNEARSVDKGTGQIMYKTFQKNIFARHIDSQRGFIWRGENISLADIMAEGNGFGTGDYDKTIDNTTGMSTDKVSNVVRASTGYVKVEHNPFVDGIFVPDGGDSGRVKISSIGDYYNNCPDTVGVCWSEIIPNHSVGIAENGRRIEISLDGTTYGQVTNPSLFMHANIAVTFDLENIRLANSTFKITSFTVLCGIVDTAMDKKETYPLADFIVLLDGKECYRRNHVRVGDGAEKINIKIVDDNRYLTLMVTDGGNGHRYDWGIYARPMLEIEAAVITWDGEAGDGLTDSATNWDTDTVSTIIGNGNGAVRVWDAGWNWAYSSWDDLIAGVLTHNDFNAIIS